MDNFIHISGQKYKETLKYIQLTIWYLTVAVSNHRVSSSSSSSGSLSLKEQPKKWMYAHINVLT